MRPLLVAEFVRIRLGQLVANSHEFGYRSLVLSTLVAALLSDMAQAQSLPRALDGIDFKPTLGDRVPLDLVWRDEADSEIPLGKYFDGQKPVILVLAYYRCPMLCNLTLNGLTESLQKLAEQRGLRIGEHFTVVTISFDHRETAELAAAKKKAHVEQYGHPGADAGWHFLTGDQTAIDRLAQAVHFQYRRDPANGEYAHTSGILLLTPRGRIARFFPGIEYAATDLYYGLVEASEHRVGRPVVDRAALLFCYTYNPNAGTYRMSVINAVRIGGVLTVLLLAAFLIVMWRREARRHPLTAIPGGEP